MTINRYNTFLTAPVRFHRTPSVQVSKNGKEQVLVCIKFINIYLFINSPKRYYVILSHSPK